MCTILTFDPLSHKHTEWANSWGLSTCCPQQQQHPKAQTQSQNHSTECRYVLPAPSPHSVYQFLLLLKQCPREGGDGVLTLSALPAPSQNLEKKQASGTLILFPSVPASQLSVSPLWTGIFTFLTPNMSRETPASMGPACLRQNYQLFWAPHCPSPSPHPGLYSSAQILLFRQGTQSVYLVLEITTRSYYYVDMGDKQEIRGFTGVISLTQRSFTPHEDSRYDSTEETHCWRSYSWALQVCRVLRARQRRRGRKVNTRKSCDSFPHLP